MLAGVSAVGDAEAKVKVEALQQVIAEVVSLDHAKVVEGSVSNGEFHTVIGFGEGKKNTKGTVRLYVTNSCFALV